MKEEEKSIHDDLNRPEHRLFYNNYDTSNCRITYHEKVFFVSLDMFRNNTSSGIDWNNLR